MTLRIVGFEGGREPDSPVNWGVAALADDRSLINALTRHRTPISQLEELVAEGHISRVADLEVKQEFEDAPLIIMELARKDAAFPTLAPDTGKAGGLVQHKTGRQAFLYVFSGQESFDRYANDVATKIVHTLLYRAEWSEKGMRQRVLRAGCVIASHHPGLNALRIASLARRHRERAKTFALKGLHGESERERFLDLFEALTSDGVDDYVIKYEDGIAQGGGLNVDDGERILGSARAAHKPFAAEIVRLHPYLEAPPPPRFRNMKAASASLHFTSRIEGQAVGERIARQLELRMLERNLRGEVLLTAPSQGPLDKALRTLRAPDEATTVSHVPIGGREERLGEVGENTKSRAQRSEPLTVLGYQSGLIKLAGEVEVVVFPPSGKHHRNLLRLSTHDDGDGNEPVGVKPLQEGDRSILYQPMLFTLMRTIDRGGRETTHLRRVQAIPPGHRGTLTALPSSVVDGALMHGFSFSFRRIGKDRFGYDLGSFSGLDRTTLRGARDWMSEFANLCLGFEIEPKARVAFKYWRPARPPAPTALQRILLVLTKHGGALHQSELIDRINERFGGSIRTNNTRREVLANSDLLKFDKKNSRIICLQKRGELFAAAYERAGGRSVRPKAKATAERLRRD